MQFVALNYSRCVEKSHFGAVTFGRRVYLSSHVRKGLSKLKSGKECDGFVTLVSGADFRRDDRCFIGFLLLKHFVFFFPLRKHD